jgi:hypothetical protein
MPRANGGILRSADFQNLPYRRIMAINNNIGTEARRSERRLQAAVVFISTLLPPEGGVPNASMSA